jgi:small subunit ribosomal protein S9
MQMSGQYYEGIGRRKTSTARVRLHSGGTGSITVNDKPIEQYFGRPTDAQNVAAPLKLAGVDQRFDVTVKVSGGGDTGQADAAAMGVARALLEVDEELKPMLRKAGYLTRDARAKERKKPGLKRARKAPQYTKR